MEPTGIEPVTSCLQSARSLLELQRPIMPICRDIQVGPCDRVRRGCTPIIGDYRRFRHFWR
jgi:hypothetical protein